MEISRRHRTLSFRPERSEAEKTEISRRHRTLSFRPERSEACLPADRRRKQKG